MTEREAFEEWVKESGQFTDWSRDKTSEANEYHKPLVERTWQGWQAACRWSRSLPRGAEFDYQNQGPLFTNEPDSNGDRA